jgi:hypothetical protein
MKPEADSFERDPALEREWRAHSGEAPPPELDRAILAAAHRGRQRPQDALKAPRGRAPPAWWCRSPRRSDWRHRHRHPQLTPQEPSPSCPRARWPSRGRAPGGKARTGHPKNRG